MENPIEVSLPGGIALEGGCERHALLRPVTGFIEKHIHEVAARARNAPAAVSEILGAALECVGTRAVDRWLVSDLGIADRQYLVLRLAILTRGSDVWMQAVCTSCGAPFDLNVDIGGIPVKQAAAGYPLAEIELPRGTLTVRVPNGGDQEAVCGLPPEEAEMRLRERCVLEMDGIPTTAEFASRLEPWEVAAIESALDEVSPQLATTLTTRCPECAAEQAVHLQPYALLDLDRNALLEDIHALARHYHWSEEQILALPRMRRRQYLALIDRDRGLHS